MADPTWGEAFEAEALGDGEEDAPDDPYADEQVDAAFFDPLSEAALVSSFRHLVCRALRSLSPRELTRPRRFLCVRSASTAGRRTWRACGAWRCGWT